MTKDHSLAVTLRPYVAGGSGAIFSPMCIHPIDLVKVRLQVANSTVEGKVSAVSIAKNVVKNEGVKGPLFRSVRGNRQTGRLRNRQNRTSRQLLPDTSQSEQRTAHSVLPEDAVRNDCGCARCRHR